MKLRANYGIFALPGSPRRGLLQLVSLHRAGLHNLTVGGSTQHAGAGSGSQAPEQPWRCCPAQRRA